MGKNGTKLLFIFCRACNFILFHLYSFQSGNVCEVYVGSNLRNCSFDFDEFWYSDRLVIGDGYRLDKVGEAVGKTNIFSC